MPLYICSQCGTIENTACANYWHDVLVKGKMPMCSECDPAFGEWHGRFPKRKPTPQDILDIMGGECVGHPAIDDEGKYIDMADAVVVHAITTNTRDNREKFVVRRWYSIGTGKSFPDPSADVYDDLLSARKPLEECGLVCFARDPSDDPVIVESWI